MSSPFPTPVGKLTLTVTSNVSIPPQPSVTVTVYTVVSVGLAVGLGQVVQLNPAAGDQLNVKLLTPACKANPAASPAGRDNPISVAAPVVVSRIAISLTPPPV